MKAILRDRYGSPDVLELREIEKPEPTDDGMLVRVRATSVNPVDWHLMRGEPYLVRLSDGLRRPKDKFLGVDVAGVVEAVGKDVTEFEPGDEVFGSRSGAFAEYVVSAKRVFAHKPANLTFEQAAAVPVAATTALQALRDKGGVTPGQKVLINGAGGGVGTFAVQIAKSYGAEVTGVTSTPNLEMVRSIGADHVIDYTREDFTRSGLRYDLIVDVAGSPSLSRLRRAASPDGALVLVGAGRGNWFGPMARPLGSLAIKRFVKQRMAFFLAQTNKEDMLVLKGLLEAGKIKPVIDRTYPLSETAEAIRYLETGHARGKVVVTL